MNVKSLGTSVINAAKVTLGAVLLAGGAIRANISDDTGGGHSRSADSKNGG